MEDLSLIRFTVHVQSLKKEAAKCQSRGFHSYVREVKALVNGVWVAALQCKCGTTRKATRNRKGVRRNVYVYPEGYCREKGSGRRTAAMNVRGWELYLEMLPEVDEL
jgi:hypothetical protein